MHMYAWDVSCPTLNLAYSRMWLVTFSIVNAEKVNVSKIIAEVTRTTRKDEGVEE